ncbi:sulfite exporter TauE/SafE family protein [Paludifilum halophilum]|uniref:Probable membrane transporter protein n=1 Tax=Paludifilum halophilum TaxID=1642702 RepID=A0A235B3I4_9BACL|nr:sulfite exporter TauE/SafE family protein [Paludifilum halophilum]OYD06185.1 hypothetical protein CHM34_17665 [Paludifilum halophilum]
MTLDWLVLIGIGLVSGTMGSLVGLGGGVITVPALLLLASTLPSYTHITPQIAVGTSMVLVVVTALSSTISYARQQRVDMKSGWAFFMGSGPGAILGAYLTRFFQTGPFFIAFGLVMILMAIILTFRNRFKAQSVKWSVRREFTDPKGNIYRYGYHLPTALIGSFAVGGISSLFGIGGGALLMPMMVLLFQFPPHVATATSMFVIFLSSIVGSATHLFQGHIAWHAVLFIAPGAWIGGQLGAWVSKKLSGRGLMLVLRLAIVVVGLRMILEGLS